MFKGELYVGTTDAPNENDWAHVYRYRGGQTWEDLGRVGSRRTRGVTQQTVTRVVDGDVIDVSNDVPLQIGFGPQSHFHGQMREVRLYNRALAADEIQSRYKQESLQLKLAD